jgi:uncharacterized protein (TIGR03435 family)
MDCLRRRLCGLCFAVIALAIMVNISGACAWAQSVSTAPEFEAATIKPVTPGSFDPSHPKVTGIQLHEARVSYSFMALEYLIVNAYKILPSQLSGPGWMGTEFFDIEARFPKGATREDEPKMMQALLKDRFKLAFHIEKKELDSYALVVGKHGAKLKPSLPDPPEPAADEPLKPGESYMGDGDAKTKVSINKDGSSTTYMGKYGTMTTRFDLETMSMHWERSKMTMKDLAGQLAFCTGGNGHKVDDETGINGNFQIAFDCPIGGPRPPSGDASDAMPSDPQGESLNRSLDALGLKLEKRKVLMDIYVVDHVEEPSED